MVQSINPDEDVPSPIDLRDPTDAKAWADAAEDARPGRSEVRSAIAAELARLPQGARVLELGSGPGFLAEHVLQVCHNIATYTLFDFSEPMLEMSRSRLARFDNVELRLGDFKSENWSAALSKPYHAVVAMQSVHELRHKRHVPTLYKQLHALLDPGGLLLVADHTPKDTSLRAVSLMMTAQEQLDAFQGAGFGQVRVVMAVERLILVRGTRSPNEAPARKIGA